jgi:drug/metabolite transporter (DMT)-like permease
MTLLQEKLTTKTTPSTALVWTALGVVYVVWGSTYLAIRVAVETVPPFLGAGLRFVVAAVLLGAILGIRKGIAELRVTWRELGAAALIGGLLLFGGNGLVMYGEKSVTSGLAALLVASVPLWVVLLRSATGDRPRLATFGGVGLGMVGLAVLTLTHTSGHGSSLGGIVMIFAASISWTIGSFISPRVGLPKNPFVASTYEMLCGGVLLLLGATLAGEFRGFSFADVSRSSWLALAYLVVAGSVLAFSAYVWLLGNAPISLIATYAYVNPGVAVLLGWIILSETITVPMLAGALLVICAVAVVVTTERPRTPKKDAAAT